MKKAGSKALIEDSGLHKIGPHQLLFEVGWNDSTFKGVKSPPVTHLFSAIL